MQDDAWLRLVQDCTTVVNVYAMLYRLLLKNCIILFLVDVEKVDIFKIDEINKLDRPC